MTIQLTPAARSAMADGLTTHIGNAAFLRIYSGTKPANAAAALSGNTLLAELVCGSPFAPAAASGVITANAITQDSSADASGVATFFRVVKSDGTTVAYQGDVTATGGGGDCQLVSTTLVATQPVQITSLTITQQGA